MGDDAISAVFPGDVLAGKYEVVDVLGIGGMGIVLECRHVKLGKHVAVKLLQPKAAAMPEMVKRFAREARAAAQLTNKHVARVLDVDVHSDGRPFMVMEYLQGHDLDEELARRGTLEIPEAVDYILQACTAVAQAHAIGIVHRDLKPHNLYLTSEDGAPCIKLLDFGISKMPEEEHPSVTQTASALGTPLYMSPEQIRSAKHVDTRTDIWSLGVMLYELLVGKTPFDGETATAVVAAITADTPTPVTHARPDVPAPLSEAIMKALEKRPANRFQSVAELAEAVAPFGSSGGWVVPPQPSHPRRAFESMSQDPSTARTQRVVSHTEPSWETASHARRRRRAGSLVIGVVAVLAGVTIGVVLMRGGEHPSSVPSGAEAPSVLVPPWESAASPPAGATATPSVIHAPVPRGAPTDVSSAAPAGTATRRDPRAAPRGKASGKAIVPEPPPLEKAPPKKPAPPPVPDPFTL